MCNLFLSLIFDRTTTVKVSLFNSEFRDKYAWENLVQRIFNLARMEDLYLSVNCCFLWSFIVVQHSHSCRYLSSTVYPDVLQRNNFGESVY